jgi:hypothetical protein
MSSGSFRAIRFGGMRHGTFNLKWVVNDGNMHYKKKKANSGRFKTIQKCRKTVWNQFQAVFSRRFKTV